MSPSSKIITLANTGSPLHWYVIYYNFHMDEVQWNSTSILMQILTSDWLSHLTLSAISVQWLDVIYEMATFFRFSNLSRKMLVQMVN